MLTILDFLRIDLNIMSGVVIEVLKTNELRLLEIDYSLRKASFHSHIRASPQWMVFQFLILMTQ